MIKSILSTIALLSLLNCQFQKNTNTAEPKPVETTNQNPENMQDFSIKQDENKQIKGTDLNVQFVGIIEESRCPIGVTCVWEGVAVAELQVMTPSSRPRTIHLGTTEIPGRDLKKTAEVYGYKISLISLEPYPNEEKKTIDNESKIVINIEKVK